jgi:hypothetical protein
MKPLSTDMAECAAALRRIRVRLYELVQRGQWPVGSFADISRVCIESTFVADSLERLAQGSAPAPKTPTPYDADERR